MHATRSRRSSDSGANSDKTTRRALDGCFEDESLADPEELEGASALSTRLRQFFVPGLAEIERRFRGMGIECEASSFVLESVPRYLGRTIRVLRPNE